MKKFLLLLPLIFLTSCNCHMHWCLDIKPETCPPKERGIKLGYKEIDIDDYFEPASIRHLSGSQIAAISEETTETVDIINVPFANG